MNTHQDDFRSFRDTLVKGDGAIATWAPRVAVAAPMFVFLWALGAATPALAEFDAELQKECLAMNIYHEARGEPDAGRVAVGHVVMNRAADPRFPEGICEVVRQGGESPRYRCQFSRWCDGRSDAPRDVAAWEQARQVAGKVLDGGSPDPTAGALWYHADYVDPSWVRKLKRGPTIGRHTFYLPVRPLKRVVQLGFAQKLANADRIPTPAATGPALPGPAHIVAPGRVSSLPIYD